MFSARCFWRYVLSNLAVAAFKSESESEDESESESEDESESESSDCLRKDRRGPGMISGRCCCLDLMYLMALVRCHC